MQARLKVLHDKANVKQVKLLPVTLIGRSTDCNLKIASSQVSRNHCRITLGEDAVFVEDLGSANGTIVNGQSLPAHQPTSINPGSHLVVGPAEFLVDFSGSTTTTAVLPGVDGLHATTLPTTEVIPPSTKGDTRGANAETSAPVGPPLESAVVAVPPQPQPPVDGEVVVQLPVEAQEPAPAASDEIAASEPTAFSSAETESLPFDSQQAANEPAFGDFANASEDGAFEEPAQFEFQESASVVPDVSANPVDAAEGKKPGLKSLFSLFGRKGQPSKPVKSGAAATRAGAAPSVFLPTLDQQAGVESADADADASPVGYGTPAAVEEQFAPDSEEPESAAVEQAADEDDGFQQFLQQL